MSGPASSGLPFFFLMQHDTMRLTVYSTFPKLSGAGISWWRKESIWDPGNGHNSDHHLEEE